MTRGGLCVKLNDYEKRHYHPDRLLYPLRRTGPKGSKQFERITWDEALDEITTKWKAIIEEHGPHAIMPNSYLGNQGLTRKAERKVGIATAFSDMIYMMTCLLLMVLAENAVAIPPYD